MRHWLTLAAVVAQPPPHTGHPSASHGGLPTAEPAAVSWQGAGFGAGRWDLLVHGFAVFGGTTASDGRGERDRLATSMIGLTATRPVGKGALTVRLRLSAEPVMGPRGYAELLQTGESADGLVPLRDRQHPHDFLSELGLAYRTTLPDQLIGFGYLAAVGEPGFGPASFMHRGSARALPEPPLGHHLQDGIHVSHGVVRVGIVSNGFLTLEGSAFNGRESDPDRWVPDPIRLDSYAFRALGNLGRHWAIQGSVAYLS